MHEDDQSRINALEREKLNSREREMLRAHKNRKQAQTTTRSVPRTRTCKTGSPPKDLLNAIFTIKDGCRSLVQQEEATELINLCIRRDLQ